MLNHRTCHRTGLSVAIILIVSMGSVNAAGEPTVVKFPFPKEVLNSEWVDGRYLEQTLEANAYEVFRGFSFTDRLVESGITFRHRVVDDAGKASKSVHYDHGNGVAVAGG